MSIALWICAVLTVISAGVSAGYAIAGLRGSVGDARTASKYALARSAALLITAIAAPVVGLPAFVAAIALAMILVQAFDAVVGATIRDPWRTYGPASLSAIGIACLIWALVA